MNVRKTILTLSVSAALGVSGALFAQQQDPQQQQQDPQQQQQQEHAPPADQHADIDVSDEELRQFAEVQDVIAGIQQDFSQRLEGVEDPEEAHEIQTEANEEMTAAVEDSGMSLEEYNEIAMAVQSDPELRDRLMEVSDH